MKITEFVTKANGTYFSHYRNGNLFYNIRRDGTIEHYQFPIPIEDLQNGTVHTIEKSIMVMRYIRKAMEDGTLIKIDV
jgi:hypothetical protein